MRILSFIFALLLAVSCVFIPASGADDVESGISVASDGTITATSDDGIQYVVFMVTNIHYDKLEPYVSEMVSLHGKIDSTSDRMYAFGVVGPMCLTQSIEQMNDEVNTVFALAEKYNVPVFFQMDDCTNYSVEFGDGATIDDEGNKFYNDPEMCEWIAFPEEGEEWGGQSYGKLPRWHCNWSGVPFATPGGFPCFNSPKYLAWYEKQVTEGFIEPLIANYTRLKEEGKSYLLAGINTGWETQIPDYTDKTYASLEEFEKAQYGMHALHNLGYDARSIYDEAVTRMLSETEVIRELLYEVIADYIEFTCKMFYDAGIEKSKIFSHIVSVSSYLGGCSTEYPPTEVCINDYCTPGWTMSPKTCQYNLAQLEKELGENGRNEYVNAEGYAHYDDVATCTAYFEESLCGNAKLITVFGYDQATGTYGYQKSPDFYFVKVVKSWLAREIGPNYTWATRPSLISKLNTCKTCGGTLSNGFCLTDNSHYDVPFKDSSGFYKIKNAGNLYWFCEQVNSGNNGIYCRLACDISDNIDIYDSNGNLKSDNFRAWTPIGKKAILNSNSVAFNGVFDGCGYTLRNFYNANEDDYTALIGYLGSSGIVRNVNISSSYFKGGNYVSGLVALNEGTIQNSCSSSAVGGARYLGGIAGQNKGTINNCYSVGVITGTGTSSFLNPATYVGAICGDGETVSNCYYLNGSASADGTNQCGIGVSRWGTSSDSAGVTEAKSLAQFSSGEVAYFLQGGSACRIWGQKSNTSGSLPVISGKPMHAVAKYDSDTGYSVGSICDLDSDRSIGSSDYQIIINMVLGEHNTEETAEDSVEFARADADGDGVVDVLDAAQAWRLYFGYQTLDVFGAGDFNGDGVCTDEDTTSIKQTITNKKYVGKSSLMACDFNGDGSADGYDLEEAFGISAVDNFVYFDTKYGDDDRHYFDLYIPKDKKTVGIVLMLHGGAWMYGDENEFAGRLEQVAKEGYAGVAVRYRYIDENVNLDDIMDDIEQAMTLVKKIAESNGVEISGFLSTGGSAGGHLSLQYAYSRADTSPIPPKAVVSYCGPADLTDDYYYFNEDLQANNGIGDKEYVALVLGYASGYPHSYATRAEAKEALKFVSPVYYIDGNTVPTVINHGVMDDIVPYRNAVVLDAKLTEYGIEHVLNTYPTSGHGLDLDAENVALAERLLWEYIEKYLDSV